MTPGPRSLGGPRLFTRVDFGILHAIEHRVWPLLENDVVSLEERFHLVADRARPVRPGDHPVEPIPDRLEQALDGGLGLGRARGVGPLLVVVEVPPAHPLLSAQHQRPMKGFGEPFDDPDVFDGLQTRRQPERWPGLILKLGSSVRHRARQTRQAR